MQFKTKIKLLILRRGLTTKSDSDGVVYLTGGGRDEKSSIDGWPPT